MPLVLDASAVLPWIFADERDAEALALAEAVLVDGAIVPALWRWEVQNALLVAQRRGRIAPNALDGALEYLRALPIETEPVGSAVGFGGELENARRFSLSVYDAAYLDLALRRSARVATRDPHLGAAADALKIRWLPSN
jgi:predicted nucleic acid-binding protein